MSFIGVQISVMGPAVGGYRGDKVFFGQQVSPKMLGVGTGETERIGYERNAVSHPKESL